VRRIALLIATMALIVAVTATVAWAQPIQCVAGTPCFGTNQADELVGTADPDEIFGLGGPDLLLGRAGDDLLSGGSGDDDVRGAGGADDIRGGAGDDELSGGGGTDTITAGVGNDTVFGGGANDVIDVSGDQANGFQDEVFCGAGDADEVTADANDIVAADCEIVLRV
jgi:Ca2+-binding RTX toxin-like protein